MKIGMGMVGERGRGMKIRVRRGNREKEKLKGEEREVCWGIKMREVGE